MRQAAGKHVSRRLENHPSFETKSPSQAVDKLSKSYKQHQVHVAPGDDLHVVHHQATLSSISINYLEYGAEVGISVAPINDWYMVQVPIAGSTSNRTPNEEQLILPGTALVIDCQSDISQQWSADCCQIQIKIDRNAIEQHLNRMLGTPIKEPVRFDLIIDLDEPKIASWWRFIEFLITEFEKGESAMTIGPSVNYIESTIITNLLIAQRHNYSEALLDIESGVVPAHVKKAEDYIRENITQTIAIDDLVDIAGVSKRTLYEGFRRFRHTSPMNFLRSYRMEKVHTANLPQTRSNRKSLASRRCHRMVQKAVLLSPGSPVPQQISWQKFQVFYRLPFPAPIQEQGWDSPLHPWLQK